MISCRINLLALAKSLSLISRASHLSLKKAGISLSWNMVEYDRNMLIMRIFNVENLCQICLPCVIVSKAVVLLGVLVWLQELGVGSYSTCRKCVHKTKGTEYAVKVRP